MNGQERGWSPPEDDNDNVRRGVRADSRVAVGGADPPDAEMRDKIRYPFEKTAKAQHDNGPARARPLSFRTDLS